MGSRLSEANMDALNRSFARMDMESRHRRGLERRHHDDRCRYDEDYDISRDRFTRDESRRRRGMESHHLHHMDGFDEEYINPPESSTRGASRKRQDIGFETIDRPHLNNIPRALGSGHRSRPRTANSDLSLAKVLVQHDKAQKEQQQHEEAMRYSGKGSVAYNEAVEQRYQAKLRVEHLTKELFKHDPDKEDMDRAQRIIAMQIYSRDERHRETGRSSTPTPTREHNRREYTAGRGGDYDPRQGHGGRVRDFY